MLLHIRLLGCAPGRAQARNQTLAVAKHLGIDQPQHRNPARFKIARFVQIAPPLRLRTVVAAIDFNRQLDRRKIKIDDPVAHRPLALEFARQRTAAKLVENLFERGFGRRRRWSAMPAPANGVVRKNRNRLTCCLLCRLMWHTGHIVYLIKIQ